MELRSIPKLLGGGWWTPGRGKPHASALQVQHYRIRLNRSRPGGQKPLCCDQNTHRAFKSEAVTTFAPPFKVFPVSGNSSGED